MTKNLEARRRILQDMTFGQMDGKGWCGHITFSAEFIELVRKSHLNWRQRRNEQMRRRFMKVVRS